VPFDCSTVSTTRFSVVPWSAAMVTWMTFPLAGRGDGEITL